MITQEILHELFFLDQEGGLVRRKSVGRVKAGTKSKTKNTYGYYVVIIDRKKYLVHRLVWLYVYGAFPSGMIDHINRIKTDNRPENLRNVTSSENVQNKAVQKNNKSGYKGVWMYKQRNCWCAGISFNGKQKHIGCFKTAEEAYKAYQEAATVYHTTNAVAINR